MRLDDEDRMSVRATAWMKEARSTYRRFEQDQVWVDSNGSEWDIDKLETQHLLNIIPFLERKAHKIAYLHGLGAAQLSSGPLAPTPGSHAEEIMEYELQELWELQMRDPLKWLRSTPLMRRLYQERRRRELDARRQLDRVRFPVHFDPPSREHQLEATLAEVLDLMNRRVWFPYELRNRIRVLLNEGPEGDHD